MRRCTRKPRSTLSNHRGWPPELVEQIIDDIGNDPATLYACGLTCRTWTIPSRRHLFRVVTLHSRARAKGLGELLAASNSGFVHMIHTVKLSGQWNLPTIAELLSPLPRLENVDTLELSMPMLSQPSEKGVVLLSQRLPLVASLRIHEPPLSLHNLASTIASLSSLNTLIVQRSYLMQHGIPNRTKPPPSLTPTVHNLNVQFSDFGDHSKYQSQVLSHWLLLHTTQDATRSLALTRTSSDSDPLAGQILAGWISVGLQHLDLTLSTATGKRSPPIIYQPRLSHTPGVILHSLSACTRLHTFKIQYVNRRSPYSNQTYQLKSALLGIKKLFTKLCSTALRDITLSVQWETWEPRVILRRSVQFTELCLDPWFELEAVLMQERFAHLEKLIVVSDGDKDALQDFLQLRCPVLHERGLLVLTSGT